MNLELQNNSKWVRWGRAKPEESSCYGHVGEDLLVAWKGFAVGQRPFWGHPWLYIYIFSYVLSKDWSSDPINPDRRPVGRSAGRPVVGHENNLHLSSL